MVDINQLEARIKALEARVRIVPRRRPTAEDPQTHGCTHGCTGACPDPTGDCTYGCTDACTNGCTDACGVQWQGAVDHAAGAFQALIQAEVAQPPSVELFERLVRAANDTTP